MSQGFDPSRPLSDRPLPMGVRWPVSTDCRKGGIVASLGGNVKDIWFVKATTSDPDGNELRHISELAHDSQPLPAVAGLE